VFTFKIINPRTGKVSALIDVPDKSGNEAVAMQRAATAYAKTAIDDKRATAMIAGGNPPGATLFVPATGRSIHTKKSFRVRR
jgi:hypothetical protein